MGEPLTLMVTGPAATACQQAEISLVLLLGSVAVAVTNSFVLIGVSSVTANAG